MKRALPKNPFTQETRELFMWNYSCWKCGKNENVEADHIFGRCSNSPYNLAPLCRNCHKNKTSKDKIPLFKKTAQFLETNQHQPDEGDMIFLKRVEENYGKGINNQE